MGFKKTVAREGLILIGFVVWGVLCFIAMINFSAFGEMGERLVPFLFWAGLYSYPAFLILRFIVWAVRTLKHE